MATFLGIEILNGVLQDSDLMEIDGRLVCEENNGTYQWWVIKPLDNHVFSKEVQVVTDYLTGELLYYRDSKKVKVKGVRHTNTIEYGIVNDGLVLRFYLQYDDTGRVVKYQLQRNKELYTFVDGKWQLSEWWKWIDNLEGRPYKSLTSSFKKRWMLRKSDVEFQLKLINVATREECMAFLLLGKEFEKRESQSTQWPPLVKGNTVSEQKQNKQPPYIPRESLVPAPGQPVPQVIQVRPKKQEKQLQVR